MGCRRRQWAMQENGASDGRVVGRATWRWKGSRPQAPRAGFHSTTRPWRPGRDDGKESSFSARAHRGRQWAMQENGASDGRVAGRATWRWKGGRPQAPRARSRRTTRPWRSGGDDGEESSFSAGAHRSGHCCGRALRGGQHAHSHTVHRWNARRPQAVRAGPYDGGRA